MARVTVEDCILKIPNRFELVLSAAYRTRQLSAGAPLLVERDNDKLPVVALREIANERVDPDSLVASMIQGMRRNVQLDESEQEMAAMLSEERISQDIGVGSFEEMVVIDSNDEIMIIGGDGQEIIEEEAEDDDFDLEDLSDEELDHELGLDLEEER